MIGALGLRGLSRRLTRLRQPTATMERRRKLLHLPLPLCRVPRRQIRRCRVPSGLLLSPSLRSPPPPPPSLPHPTLPPRPPHRPPLPPYFPPLTHPHHPPISLEWDQQCRRTRSPSEEQARWDCRGAMESNWSWEAWIGDWRELWLRGGRSRKGGRQVRERWRCRREGSRGTLVVRGGHLPPVGISVPAEEEEG